MSGGLQSLGTHELVDELTDDRGFTEFNPDSITFFGKGAVLARFGNDDHWFPYLTLRCLDGDVYVAEWKMKKEGLM
jgi:hypothetical protein